MQRDLPQHAHVAHVAAYDTVECTEHGATWQRGAREPSATRGTLDAADRPESQRAIADGSDELRAVQCERRAVAAERRDAPLQSASATRVSDTQLPIERMRD